LKFVINTHNHRDHTASNDSVKKAYGSKIISFNIEPGIDISITHEEILSLGNVMVKFLHTPGHTSGDICILADEKYLLTGDTLFIGDCGRTDLPNGSNKQMFASLQMIKSLPDELIIYPGHDYGPRPYDTLKNQKLTNKTLLAASIEDFSKIP